MQVILIKDVEQLGDKGDTVNVADGYARNYLFPKNLATLATTGALKDLNIRITRIRAKAEKKHQEDLAKAEKVTALETLTIEANAGEGGKLFGAITTKELAKVLTEKTGLEIDRKNMNLNHPINRVGDYQLSVKFSSKVSATLAIRVVSANAAAPEAEEIEEYDEYEA